MMQIDLWADITCPWCYLTVRHLRAALSAFEHGNDVAINLHAFYLAPELDHVWEKSHIHYMTSVHERSFEDITAAYTRLEKLGTAEGLRFDFDRVVVAPPTSAYTALAHAREADLYADSITGPDAHALRLYEAIARAYFELGLNIADHEVLIGCAQDVGLSPRDTLTALEDESYTSQSLADYHVALTMGITAVPTMLINDRFIIPGMQTQTALSNMLNTAWKAANEGDTP